MGNGAVLMLRIIPDRKLQIISFQMAYNVNVCGRYIKLLK